MYKLNLHMFFNTSEISLSDMLSDSPNNGIVICLLNNVFPVNYDYWAMRGVTNRATQAYTTRMEFPHLCFFYGLLYNEATFYQGYSAGYLTVKTRYVSSINGYNPQ